MLHFRKKVRTTSARRAEYPGVRDFFAVPAGAALSKWLSGSRATAEEQR
jgi:hypothetical protein